MVAFHFLITVLGVLALTLWAHELPAAEVGV